MIFLTTEKIKVQPIAWFPLTEIILYGEMLFRKPIEKKIRSGKKKEKFCLIKIFCKISNMAVIRKSHRIQQPVWFI